MLPIALKGGDGSVVGNIEKRGENSYRLRVAGGYTGTGKRITYKKTIQAKNKTEPSACSFVQSVNHFRNRQRTIDSGSQELAHFLPISIRMLAHFLPIKALKAH